MTLPNVPPSSAPLNVANIRPANAISCGKFAFDDLAASRPNRPYICFAEFSVAVPFTQHRRHPTKFVGMSRVLAMSDPFKIARTVVSFVAVLMVDLVAHRRQTQKCLGNQTMNPNGSPSTMSPQKYLAIPIGTWRWAKNMSRLCSWPSHNSAHLAEARHIVPAFIADDGSPFFGGSDRLRLHRKVPFGAMRSDAPQHRGRTYYSTTRGAW